MTEPPVHIDESAGELLLHTGVCGPAAAMGHRLTIAVRRWHAEVRFDGDRPIGATLDIEVASLAVLRSAGGLTPLSSPEQALVRANALRCLDARRHPRIRYDSTVITATGTGYSLDGTLAILGRRLAHTVAVAVADDGERLALSAHTRVRHSTAGVRRYSLLMGGLRVADEVGVSLTARVPRR